MNLHVCLNGNFVNHAMDVFEHFFPEENVFIIFNFGEYRMYREDIPIYRYDKNESELCDKIQKICSRYTIKNVLNHGLSNVFSTVFKCLKDNRLYSGKVYWIYWGYELYNALGEEGKYRLVDNNSPFKMLSYITPNPINALLKKVLGVKLYADRLKETLPYIDYFCSWFFRDFELLKEHYNTPVEFRYFKYISNYKSDVSDLNFKISTKNLGRIMVNHQASLTGNHDTIFQKLLAISGVEDFEVYTPLSYGHRGVRKHVLKRGKHCFKEKYKPILNLMSLGEYNIFLNSISVAIFGAMRQEAAGNIMMLLKKGVKVYLRARNPLLLYYREKGFIVFSFEEDLNDLSDLQPLSTEEQLHNIQQVKNSLVYYEDFMPSFFD